MKFMKLGSRPDQFQTDGDNIRYVATELATDMVVSVGDVKFYVHKFPLLSKSSLLQKLVANNTDKPEIDIHDIPGGPAAFEICAKFCYGMVATLNAYNVVPARCAAEYLEMYEAVDKGNLVYKIDVFLSSSIFRSWKDSIIALQTTKSFLPWSEELKIVSHCLDSIAERASTDPSRVDWSYTYDRNKTETTGLRKQLTVPRDWWVEDLCDLHIDLYKRVILTIRAKEQMAANVIGESLKAYTLKRVPFLAKKGNDVTKYSYVVGTIISLLPTEKNCVSCGFLIKLLQAAINFECGETGRAELMRRIAGRLDESSVGDFMIRSSNGDVSICDMEVVHELVERFVMREHWAQTDGCDEFEDEIMCKDFNDLDGSKGKVARLVDGYLAEAARDSSLTLTKFVGLAEMVSGFPRASHDGIYRAVDMYLKEHPSLTKSEKKRICRLMDCKKLSAVACAHAVQNERLPLRVVVQVLFFEQARAAGGSTPDLPGPVRSLLPRGSYGSSATTTTTSDEDWDGDRASEELKGELTSLRTGNDKGGVDGGDKVTAKKVKKMFSRMWSNKERRGETSESDTSASTSGEIKDAAVVRVIGRTTTNRTQKKLLETK